MADWGRGRCTSSAGWQVQSVRSCLWCVAVLPIVPLDAGHLLQLLLGVARQLAGWPGLQLGRRRALGFTSLGSQVESNPRIVKRAKLDIIVCASKPVGKLIGHLSLYELAGGGGGGGGCGGGGTLPPLGPQFQLTNSGPRPL